jgi:PAS domain S-box-containing protein
MKPTILIIEDSYIASFHLKKILESEGYEVLASADSGEMGLELLQHTRPDIVLTDIMLCGKLDGIETASIIQEIYGLPVVYITALEDKETIQRAKMTQPYGYLTKPFKDGEIIRVIEMTLHKREMEIRLKRNEEQFYTILNSISDAVISIDTDFRVIYMNPSSVGLTGYNVREAIGKSFFETFHFFLADEPSFNPFQCCLFQGMQNGIPKNVSLTSKSGKKIAIGDGCLSPIIDSKGKLKGLVLTFKDISDRIERKKLKVETERNRMIALVEGQEKERSRIAKDLHDGLGQLLNAIKMKANFILEENEYSEELFQLLDEALVETKKISENLLPSKLRDFDLSVCIKSLCKQMVTSTTAAISFDSFGVSSTLSELQKVNLYRIAQEGITNALKHGNSSHVHVQLNVVTDVLQLTIEDDGVGMMQENTNVSKHGLLNMRDRTKVLNGKFLIESDKSRGTVIMVEVPLN